MDIHTLTTAMKLIQNLGNLALLVLVYAATVIAFGVWWKLMVELFCIGYGC